MILVPFPEMRPLAEDLAPALEAELLELDWHRFPDGESLISLPGNLDGADVALLATLRDPDRPALPLRFAAATAREMGARGVGLIAPYLGYMRQDRRFEAGQAVSAPLFAQFLGKVSTGWWLSIRICTASRNWTMSSRCRRCAPCPPRCWQAGSRRTCQTPYFWALIAKASNGWPRWPGWPDGPMRSCAR